MPRATVAMVLALFVVVAVVDASTLPPCVNTTASRKMPTVLGVTKSVDFDADWRDAPAARCAPVTVSCAPSETLFLRRVSVVSGYNGTEDAGFVGFGMPVGVRLSQKLR